MGCTVVENLGVDVLSVFFIKFRLSFMDMY
jgi:hypothetical protein